ncbi:energy transducer TonB [Paraburkholderia sp. CNPSo 3281]|uniref:energy transducer TonB n=1 Tax=Paraburkholderia sp. CNPSo 3281 TaxID=2940933 RepID=UPI0020B8F0B0|nr:energy transducer TonB [Paraburkholderia sp. CNPSo 3281]MCP3717579.1 energy transducer TonB [Paraburkholderia sp. CNPSo 3281]
MALAVWTAFVSIFVAGLAENPEPARPLTLDARIVEVITPAPPHPPTTVARPAPNIATPSRPVHVVRPINRPAAPAPTPLPAHTESPLPAAAAAPPASTTAHASAESASASSALSGTRSAASGDTTAHPLIQPLPVLPDDLRESAYQAIALARFTIHPDGSVDVALVRPTQNPRLNQLLLETLRNWHFFPAMKQGHPVESEQDIRVHFNIE